ncbi:Sua5/YciO/YrdC/YwlC family protein [Rubrobacter taiwanensis]|jgi:L-threonylcarbamoyladenylate synthase|uniref:L-threonylcarbamoyladenylate synthase n=1 Tax=Rubrobacter taiwanensis TaxID=185139 RepID=A0A4R1BP86_9ACTN|nr:L-threonylcarbamoyladenylate synthase [Rubrobacter taiwanensis]TCJ19409.1 Sua5/YciO/YrdC/YwlC family protein [Rubrobacter taiwanensis]
MEDKLLSPEEAAKALREGKVGLIPTETVVGLVAAEDRRLNEMKLREPGKPVALLCRSVEEAFSLARSVPGAARRLAERLWPGPLTLVLESGDGGTVGVRVPGRSAVVEVLRHYGAPLYATSANITGQPAPAALEEVDPRVFSAVDFAVAGERGSGEASAVVDFSQATPRVLRPAGEVTEGYVRRLHSGEGS